MSPPPGPTASTGLDLALVQLDDDGQPYLVLSDQPAPQAGPPDAGATVATGATGGGR